ncbi:SDR family NAD(P)-dependent oxidoreductase [Streptomyces sp. NPDC090075]|uniref:SDR family NAD(P)-dependent oxidoreductase n=1 Tax=Streptomyces sp. NPDC090075 TaxID=3365937 RepID=UPI00382B7DC2
MSDGPRLTTSFTRDNTADEVLAGVDLTGRRAVVTGAASGLGTETARALARAGAEVTLAVRDLDAGRKAAGDIAATTGSDRVEVGALDLTDQDSVASFAAGWSGPLHILVNNAGIMAVPELRRTREGWEQQFATNHLGHFRLALGLHHALAAEGARVVSVSSFAHLLAPVDFDDIHFDRRPYDPWVAYGQSKTANVLFAVEASRRWGGDRIATNALHPGGIQTGIQRHQSAILADNPEAQEVMARFPWRTPEQGAATSVFLAASPLAEGVRGRYFQNCNEAALHDPATGIGHEGEPAGVAAHAVDTEAAVRLWALSEKMLGI